MAIVYYPQGTKIEERNTVSGSQVVMTLAVQPTNAIFYFKENDTLTGSNMVDSASYAVTASYAQNASATSSYTLFAISASSLISASNGNGLLDPLYYADYSTYFISPQYIPTSTDLGNNVTSVKYTTQDGLLDYLYSISNANINPQGPFSLALVWNGPVFTLANISSVEFFGQSANSSRIPPDNYESFFGLGNSYVTSSNLSASTYIGFDYRNDDTHINAAIAISGSYVKRIDTGFPSGSYHYKMIQSTPNTWSMYIGTQSVATLSGIITAPISQVGCLIAAGITPAKSIGNLRFYNYYRIRYNTGY